MSFKVGDRVRCDRAYPFVSLKKDEEYIVLDVQTKDGVSCIKINELDWLLADRFIFLDEAAPKAVSSKELNPKATIGSYALPVTLVSPLLIAHISLAKLNGKLKYGGANYIGTEVSMSTYLDAMQRHLDKLKMGEVVDEVDGVHHFGAIGANMDIILAAQTAGTLVDDRLRCDGQLEAYKALTPMVKSLIDLHKDRNPKHYYLVDKEKDSG